MKEQNSHSTDANGSAASSAPQNLVLVVEIPPLKSIDEAIEFDRIYLEMNPHAHGIRRRCLAFELPPGVFEKLSKIGPVFVHLMRAGPGYTTKMVATGDICNMDPPMMLHGIFQDHYESYSPPDATPPFEF
jgi:hypothetical protein